MSKIALSVTKYIKYGFNTAQNLIVFLATVFTIFGTSLRNFTPKYFWDCPLCERAVIIIAAFAGLSFVIGYCFFWLNRKRISLTVHNNNVIICYGDIFETCGYKVIPCDTTFSTEADDKNIAKSSLQGQFILKHADKDKVIEAVRETLQKSSGVTKSKTGKIIKYENPCEPNTYLLLALSELDEDKKAHTNMAEFIQTLLQMWKKIDGEYNNHDIVLPLLGAGITRFDDGFKGDPDKNLKLLYCILYTLYLSGIYFNSTLKIVLREDINITLHEVKYTLRRLA